MTDIYDVMIVGGGPAGMSAGLQTARNKLKTVIFEPYELGGKIMETATINNYIGGFSNDTYELSGKMISDVKKYDIEVNNARITKYTIHGIHRLVTLFDSDGNEYVGKTAIFAIGTEHKKLDILEQYEVDVSYCALCDAEFQEGKNVLVIGGGDTAFESAILLSKYAKEVTILHRNTPKAQRYLTNLVDSTDNIKLVYGEVEDVEIIDDKVYIETNGELTYYNSIFVCIGNKSRIFDLEYIETDLDLHESLKKYNEAINSHAHDTNIFFAGDMTNDKYQQVAVAVGDGMIAGIKAIDVVMKQDGERLNSNDLNDPLTRERLKNK